MKGYHKGEKKRVGRESRIGITESIQVPVVSTPSEKIVGNDAEQKAGTHLGRGNTASATVLLRICPHGETDQNSSLQKRLFCNSFLCGYSVLKSEAFLI